MTVKDYYRMAKRNHSSPCLETKITGIIQAGNLIKMLCNGCLPGDDLGEALKRTPGIQNPQMI